MNKIEKTQNQKKKKKKSTKFKQRKIHWKQQDQSGF